MTIRHTSSRAPGRVYVPAVNWALCAAVAALVVGFGSSSALAAAYGIAVTGTMAITTILFFFVVRTRWRKPLWLVVAGAAAFVTIDLTLFSASLTKVPHGGWVPLTTGLAVLTILTTWRKGHEIVIANRVREEGARPSSSTPTPTRRRSPCARTSSTTMSCTEACSSSRSGP